MKTSSAKSKGRVLQQIVRNSLRLLGYSRGLVDEDLESRGMGQNGVDVILTPAAKKVFSDLSIECKNHEKLNVVGIFWAHAAKYPKALNFLVHKKNRTEPLITLKWYDFVAIFERSLNAENK